jgi:predicted dehydrogenase
MPRTPNTFLPAVDEQRTGHGHDVDIDLVTVTIGKRMHLLKRSVLGSIVDADDLINEADEAREAGADRVGLISCRNQGGDTRQEPFAVTAALDDWLPGPREGPESASQGRPENCFDRGQERIWACVSAVRQRRPRGRKNGLNATADPPSTNVAVVGLGYWGPHYSRILSELPSSNLRWCCDRDEGRLESLRRRYPWAQFTTDIDDLLGDPELDAVVVATPTASHRDVVVACLGAKKDVLVEKPLAASIEECKAIEAAAGDAVVMVGHTFVYNAGIVALRELIATQALGKLRYAKSVRVGLGPIRDDVNVLWDLGPHDVSILLDLIPSPAISVSATGQSFLRDSMEDVVFLSIHFDDGIIGHAQLSWIDPYKVRSTTVVGDRRMAVFDDVALDERLKILDRGASYSAPSELARGLAYGESRAILREGDINIPRLAPSEPLVTQVNDFLGAVAERRQPYSGLRMGLDVVAVLEATQESLRNGGRAVAVDGAS